jgi:hypothetical protein
MQALGNEQWQFIYGELHFFPYSRIRLINQQIIAKKDGLLQRIH